MVFTSTTPWKPKNVKIFHKVRNWRNWILSVPRVSLFLETKSPWLRQYQSYISNWYINGKVFTSTTTWEPRNLIFFFKKVRNWILLVFWLVLKSWIHSSGSQHAPIYRHWGMHRRPFEGRHLVCFVFVYIPIKLILKVSFPICSVIMNHVYANCHY